MKNLALAAITVFGLSTAAYADGLSFGGSVEYQVEAEKFEATIGTAVSMGAITLSPEVTAYYTEAEDISFDGMDLTASYMMSATTELYATVETDADLEYEEVSVGVAFTF